jgi:hypothetical protein
MLSAWVYAALMVYQLASVRVEVGTHEVASWDRGRNLSAYSLSHQANIAGFAFRSFVLSGIHR